VEILYWPQNGNDLHIKVANRDMLKLSREMSKVMDRTLIFIED
jgi:hypothetical protein